MDSHEARYKLLKLQPNSNCRSGVFLTMKSSTLFAKENILEVNCDGINIQPKFNKSVSINTFSIKGPFYRQSMPPADFIPGMFNITPRKTLDIPFETELESMKVTLFGLLSYLA